MLVHLFMLGGLSGLTLTDNPFCAQVLIDVIGIATRTGGKRRAHAAVKFLEARHYIMDKQLDHTLWFTSQKFRPSQQP